MNIIIGSVSLDYFKKSSIFTDILRQSSVKFSKVILQYFEIFDSGWKLFLINNF